MIQLNIPAELAQDIEAVCAEWEALLATGILAGTQRVVHDFEACRFADAHDDESMAEWSRGTPGRLFDLLFRLNEELTSGVHRGDWHRDLTDAWLASRTG